MIKKADYIFQKPTIIDIPVGEKKKLALLNDNIVIKENGIILDKTSLHIISTVIVIGNASITTELMKKMTKLGKTLMLVDWNLNAPVIMAPQAEGNYILRTNQYKTQINDIEMPKIIVKNKIQNQEKTLIKYLLVEQNSDTYTFAYRDLITAKTCAEIRGIEGYTAKIYFKKLFTPYEWIGRLPQTKIDITNVLLDVGYTYLFNFTDSLLRLFGFDTYKGVYHTLFFERKSLTCDIMEPMRPIIDQAIVKLYHLGQIKEKDFIIKDRMYGFSYKPGIRARYTGLLVKEIMGKKEQIYKYIYSWYRYTMNKEKNPEPYFTM